jgi:hypothetical protein
MIFLIKFSQILLMLLKEYVFLICLRDVLSENNCNSHYERVSNIISGVTLKDYFNQFSFW